MTSLRIRLLAIAALALAVLPVSRADAAAIIMCAPEAAVGGQPRPVNNPNTSNTYALNGVGCAVMRWDDAAYFAAQGFTQGPNTINAFFAGQSTGFQFVVPLSAYLKNITFSETTGNATSSGICVGTTNGGSDVATMVGTGSTFKTVSDSSMAKRIMSQTAATPIFIGSCAATGFGTSRWDVTIEYGYF